MMAYKTIPATKIAQKTVHLLLNLVALLAGIVGIYAVFKYHHESGIPDLYSLHSWLGIGTICLFGLQVFMLNKLIPPCPIMALSCPRSCGAVFGTACLALRPCWALACQMPALWAMPTQDMGKPKARPRASSSCLREPLAPCVLTGIRHIAYIFFNLYIYIFVASYVRSAQVGP